MKTQEIITGKIIAELEKGKIPWQKPWNAGQINLVSKKAYTGINPLLLSIEAENKGYKSPYWLTFNQIKKLNGKLVKGSKACQVVFWLVKESEEEEGKKARKSFILRYYNVFNTDCVEGLTLPETNTPAVILEAEEIIKNFKDCPKLTEGGNSAFYSPSSDTVNLPTRNSFDSEEGYYSTFFHELIHSTGHESRLARHTSNEKHNFGSESYAKEELVAELGASFLVSKAGLELSIKNHAAYIQSWLKALKNDSRMIISAAGQAEKASSYILGS